MLICSVTLRKSNENEIKFVITGAEGAYSMGHVMLVQCHGRVCHVFQYCALQVTDKIMHSFLKILHSPMDLSTAALAAQSVLQSEHTQLIAVRTVKQSIDREDGALLYLYQVHFHLQYQK